MIFNINLRIFLETAFSISTHTLIDTILNKSAASEHCIYKLEHFALVKILKKLRFFFSKLTIFLNFVFF